MVCLKKTPSASRNSLAPHAHLRDYTSGADVPLRYIAVARVNEALCIFRFDCYGDVIRALRFYNKDALSR